jgi:phage terminase small subunit
MVKRRNHDARQALFIAAYVRDPSRSLAEIAQAAGYCQKSLQSAHVQAHRLLAYPHIKAEIERRLELHMRRSGVDLEKLLTEAKLLAFARMDDYADLLASPDPLQALKEIGSEQAAAIESIVFEQDPDRTETDAKGRTRIIAGAKRVKIKLHSKLDAIKMLAIHMGMRTSRAIAIINAHGDGRGGPAAQASLRDSLAHLDPDQLQQLEAICETVERAEEAKARAPMIEHEKAEATAEEETET